VLLRRELEQESGEELLIETGGIDIGACDDPDLQVECAEVSCISPSPPFFPVELPSLQEVENNYVRNSETFERLSAEEVTRRFPHVKIPSHWRALYQPDFGTPDAFE
jgi:hypothetical protein